MARAEELEDLVPLLDQFNKLNSLIGDYVSQSDTTDQSLASSISFAATKGIIGDLLVSGNLFPGGDISLAADKKVTKESIGTAVTDLDLYKNSVGEIASVATVNSDLRTRLKQPAGGWSVYGAQDVFRVAYNGLIAGGPIPSSIASGVSASCFDGSGHWNTSDSSTGDAEHIRVNNPNGQVGGCRSNGVSTSWLTASDPELKNFADEELTIEIVKDEFTKKYIPTIHAFRYKADPNGPLILGHDAWEATDAKLMTGLGSDRIGPRDAEIGSEYDTGEKDEEGNPIMGIVSPAGVDQGKVTPMHGLLIQHLLEENDANKKTIADQDSLIASLVARLDNAGIA